MPLHIAVQGGNIEIVARLLEAGADPTARFAEPECQPLHLAVEQGDMEIATLLLDHGAHVNDFYGWYVYGDSQSPLHIACQEGPRDMVKLLLDRGADLEARGHYGTALGFAVHFRQLDVVRMLLDKGAD
ncbi:ankyrin repeat protein, partial [Mycena maculata]